LLRCGIAGGHMWIVVHLFWIVLHLFLLHSVVLLEVVVLGLFMHSLLVGLVVHSLVLLFAVRRGRWHLDLRRSGSEACNWTDLATELCMSRWVDAEGSAGLLRTRELGSPR
jgi:hypothetical protein